MFSSHFPRTAFLSSPLNFKNGKNQTPPLRQANSRAWESGGPFGIPLNLEIRTPEMTMDHFINTSAFSLLVCKMRMTLYNGASQGLSESQMMYIKTLFVNYKAISNMKTWLQMISLNNHLSFFKLKQKTE